MGAVKSGEKRKLGADAQGPVASKSKQDLLGDLIVLGLPYSTTEDELKSYFEGFGELAHCEVKMDQGTKRSKGFGFIRFRTEAAAQSAMDNTHSIGGRRVEVNFPFKNA